MKFDATTVEVKDLVLDPENPRFFSQNVSVNLPNNENQLEDLLLNEKLFPVLKDSIVKSGVLDPIWVKKLDNGKYLVVEGNLRVACLSSILNDDTPAPEGVSYDSVLANVIDPSVSELEIKLQQARLQSGKSSVSDAKIDEWFESIVKNMEVSN